MAENAKVKILTAAAELFLEMSPSDITHRAIAVKAGVPLGSTTYHFASLDELLSSAVEFSLASATTERRAWLEKESSTLDLPDTLIRMVLPQEFWDKKTAVNLYLLWLQGLGQDRTRSAIKSYTEELILDLNIVIETFSLSLDSNMLLALVDGRILQWLELDKEFSWLEESLRADISKFVKKK